MKNDLIEPFELLVLKSQIVVLDVDGDQFFNDRQSGHISQGFSWRPGVAAFGTLASCPTDVSVRRMDQFRIGPNTQRAIQVPFIVGPSDSVKMAALSEDRGVSIASGAYALLFAQGIEAIWDYMWAVFTFVPDAVAQARILIADDLLSPRPTLVMDAKPA